VLLLSAILPLAVFARIIPAVKANHARMNSSQVYGVESTSIQSLRIGITLEQVLNAAASVEANELPTRLFMDQNYPNPFNPSTMIRYGLPAGTNVRLSIHSLLGNEIKVVLDGWQDAGTYTLDLSAQDLPSGVYFYRLQTEIGTLTRRMTISK
jgi:hypothetical protein